MKIKSLVLAIAAVLIFLLGSCTGPQMSIRQRNASATPAGPDARAVLNQAYWLAVGNGVTGADVELLRSICLAQVRSGDLEGAARTVRSLDPASQGPARLALAQEWARRGRMDQATAILGSYADQDNNLDQVRACLADYQMREGDLAAAEQTARTIKDNLIRTHALFELAKGCLRVGDRHRTERLIWNTVIAAEAFPDAAQKEAAFEEAADVVDRWGKPRAAIIMFNIAGQTAAGDARRMQLLANAMARSGFLAEALATVEAMPQDTVPMGQCLACWSGPDTSERDMALCDIAIAQAKMGDFAGAKQTASQMNRGDGEALLALVRCQIQQGELSSGKETARQMPRGISRAEAMLIIAAAHARRGDRIGARAAAEEMYLNPVIRAASLREGFDYSQPSSWNRGVMINDFVMRLNSPCAAAAMDLDQALGGRGASAYAKAFAGFAPQVLRSLAYAQAAAGDPAGALAWAKRMSFYGKRAAALLGLAEGIIAREE